MLKSYLTKLKSLITQIVGLIRQGSLGRNLGRLAVVALILILASTHSAHAGNMFVDITFDMFNQLAAYVVNLALSITSWFVAMTGMLLNVSVILTMNIKGFVDSTPAIFTVWKAIRDITGLFIIFALLYASIRMIIGQDAKLGDTLKNIIIAGVLINFSFFITAFLIDASNIVSLQLYKAITPGQPDVSQSIRNSDRGSGLSAIVTQSFDDGGLSAVFMQALRVQTIFNSKNLGMQNNSASNTAMVPFRIIFIGLTGIIIMITVGLSFLFAALAFMVRMVLLLMLLAFSPIWCAAYVIPSKEIKAYGTEYWNVLVAQLTFMPAYLLLMYVAMKIISESNLFNAGGYGNLWQGATGSLPTGTPTEFISFVINAALIIIMLNLPLLAAMKLGASTGGLLDGKKLGALAVWGGAAGLAGRNTIGRWGSSLDKQLANTKIGNSSLVRDIRSSTTGALAKSKFGSSRSFEDQAKINEDVAKQRKLIEGGNTEMDKKRKAGERKKQFDSTLEEIKSGRTPRVLGRVAIKDSVGKMNEKDKLGLSIENLTNPDVIRYLKKSDFDAIKKSDDISDEDKEKVSNARKTVLEDGIRAADTDLIKDMLKSYEGTDLLKIDPTLMTNDAVMPHFTTGQLKQFGDNSNDVALKGHIADKAIDMLGRTPPVRGAGFGWLVKQRNEHTW